MCNSILEKDTQTKIYYLCIVAWVVTIVNVFGPAIVNGVQIDYSGDSVVPGFIKVVFANILLGFMKGRLWGGFIVGWLIVATIYTILAIYTVCKKLPGSVLLLYYSVISIICPLIVYFLGIHLTEYIDTVRNAPSGTDNITGSLLMGLAFLVSHIMSLVLFIPSHLFIRSRKSSNGQH